LSYIVAQYKGFIMSINAVVRARIDPQIKDEAIVVLSTMGLTLSDAFRMLLVRVAREKALPFEPLIPNDQTIKAMKAARSGDMVTVSSVNNLLASLNADD
jgi:DNA-damage-inducible protein J